MLKYITLGLLFGSASWAYSAPQCGNSDIVENRRTPITFEPIPMVNPETGETYDPTDTISFEVNGQVKTYSAQQYFDELNHQEQLLNQWGYSLRDEGQDTLGGWTQCREVWQEQGEKIKKVIREELAEYLLGDGEWDDLWDAIKDEYEKNYPDWEELYRAAQEDSYEANLPPVPPFEVSRPNIPRAPVEFTKEKTWSWEGGDKQKVYGGIYPYAKYGATKTEAKGEAGLNVKASLAGKWDGELLEAKATAVSPGTGPLKLDLSASVIDGKKKWTKTLTQAGELKWDYKYETGFSKSVKFSFELGGFPLATEFGTRGDMGIIYGIALYPLQIGAYTTPFAAADAYAQVGVDAIVASAGVGGILKIISLQLPIQGRISFEFEEEPLINLNLAATTELDMLSGNLFAYLKVNYLFDSWEKRWEFFNWEGYKKTGTIFDYSAKVNRNGIIADGDLTPEDILEQDYENRERALEALEQKAADIGYAVAQAIAEDAALPRARQVAQKAALINQLSEAHDGRMNEYYDELREFLN